MSQALKDAINEAWSSAYKGEGPVSDEKALCKRVRMLAYDRADWIKNAKALQKDNTELRSKLESSRLSARPFVQTHHQPRT